MDDKQCTLEDLVAKMDRDFWAGKKVLVTGHTGFKGGWLSLWLQRLGADVLGYSLEPPTDPSLFETAQVAEGMTSVFGDIRNLTNLEEVTRDFSPEIVIHMAAQPLVRYSYENPVETYQTNVLGTVNVLESVRKTKSVRVVLIITTDKCYENKEWLWGYRENERLGGHDPYSNSKACAELVTSAYRDSYFPTEKFEDHRVVIASARAGNVIGGGDWAKDRLIPDFLRAIRTSEPVLIRSPNAVRPWQHVLEPLSGYLELIQCLWTDGLKFSGAWNFGPNEKDSRPVSWIVNHMTELWGEGASWEIDKDAQYHEAQYLKLDCTKSKSLLGLKARVTLPTALEWIVEWFQGYEKDLEMRKQTLSQIQRFESLGYK